LVSTHTHHHHHHHPPQQQQQNGPGQEITKVTLRQTVPEGMEGFSFEESDFWLDISSVQMCVFYYTLYLQLILVRSGPEIGAGQFSTVYIGKYFGDVVAVKKQVREDVGLDSYLLRELAVLKNVSHKNLVQYIGASNEIAKTELNLNALYIVTEFCQVNS
jgi:hypothetical protein